jgi:hypothetical protein
MGAGGCAAQVGAALARSIILAPCTIFLPAVELAFLARF